ACIDALVDRDHIGFGGLRFVERGTLPQILALHGMVAGEDAVDEDRSAAAQEKETWAAGGIARARDEEGC
ncbi:unnamed protein product, partial [Pylaiella littoralis]